MGDRLQTESLAVFDRLMARAIDEVGRLVGGWIKADRGAVAGREGSPRGAAA